MVLSAGSEPNDAPKVATISHVIVALVDLGQVVGPGYKLIKLQFTAAIQIEESRYVEAWVG